MNNEEKILEILQQMQADVAGLQTQFNGMQADITDVKADIAGLQTQFNGMQETVNSIQLTVSGLQSDVGGLQADVAALKADVAGVKADVAGVKEEVAGVKADVAGVKADIGRLESKMEDGFRETRSEIVDMVEEVGRQVQQMGGSFQAVKDAATQNAFDIQSLRGGELRRRA